MAVAQPRLGPQEPRLHLVTPPRAIGSSYSALALWHLLSLDAPTVAVTWTIFIAWCAGVRLAPGDPWAMLVAVWLLYATDRLLDARPLGGSSCASAPGELEERHRFHHRHRSRFLPALAGCSVLLALLVHRLAPAVLHLYAVLAALLAGWLLLVHAQPASLSPTRLPKELAVGLFFPAAVFIPTVAQAPDLRLALLPSALLFSGVCTLNCLLLYAWEHPGDRSRAHATTRFALAYLVPLSGLLLVAGMAVLVPFPAWAAMLQGQAQVPALRHAAALPLAAMLSTGMLLLLHGLRYRLPPLGLRATADLVLLTPWPVFGCAVCFHGR